MSEGGKKEKHFLGRYDERNKKRKKGERKSVLLVQRIHAFTTGLLLLFTAGGVRLPLPLSLLASATAALSAATADADTPIAPLVFLECPCACLYACPPLPSCVADEDGGPGLFRLSGLVLSTCIGADVGLAPPALDGEFGTGVRVAMGGSVTPPLPLLLPASFADELLPVEIGGGFLSRCLSLSRSLSLSPTEALGGGGKVRPVGMPVVFAVGLLCALSLSCGGCVRKGMGLNLLAGLLTLGVLLPDTDTGDDSTPAPAPLGLLRISILERLLSGSLPGLSGRFRPCPDPEPVESTGEGPAEPGPTLRLTTCWRPPTVTVCAPDAARLIKLSATPSS